MIRLDYIDKFWTQERLDNCKKALNDFIRTLQEGATVCPQWDHSSIFSSYFRIGCYKHALGYPYSEVREALAFAGAACHETFKRLGTEKAFEAYEVTLDPRYSPEDPRYVAEYKPVNPPGSKDYSLTNARCNFEGVCMALAAGEFTLAEKLASMAWDPPDTKSCTPNDQRIAYSMKDYFAGNSEAALEKLAKVFPGQKRFIDVRFKADMIRAIITGDGDLFVVNLNALLEWHERKATRSKYKCEETELFLCSAALGLSVLALQRGVVTMNRLNPYSSYFPLEIIELAQTGERGLENLQYLPSSEPEK